MFRRSKSKESGKKVSIERIIDQEDSINYQAINWYLLFSRTKYQPHMTHMVHHFYSKRTKNSLGHVAKRHLYQRTNAFSEYNVSFELLNLHNWNCQTLTLGASLKHLVYKFPKKRRHVSIMYTYLFIVTVDL